MWKWPWPESGSRTPLRRYRSTQGNLHPQSPHPFAAAAHPFRNTLARVHRTFSVRETTLVCRSAWPDAPVLVGREIPSVSYGPGSKLCYWDDEYVPIDEYLQAIRVYAATAESWLNSESEE